MSTSEFLPTAGHVLKARVEHLSARTKWVIAIVLGLALQSTLSDVFSGIQGNRISEQCQEAGEICFVPSGPLEFAA